jgi:hypothetical protein
MNKFVERRIAVHGWDVGSVTSRDSDAQFSRIRREQYFSISKLRR